MSVKGPTYNATLLFLAFLPLNPAYAFDSAGFGVGLGLGLLGGALAGAARQSQPRYYYRRPRTAYIVPRHALVRRERHEKIVRGGLKDIAEINVSTDQPWQTRAYHNCSQPRRVASITAKAEHGFVKEEYSTRLVCGAHNFPTKQFVYLSPAGYTGSDVIEYFDRGRRVFTDILKVGGTNPQYNVATDMTIFSGQEREIVNFSGCGPLNLDLYVKSAIGFASVRESRMPGCNGAGRFTKSVFYRPPNSFLGSDSLTLDSSGHSPIVFRITVQRSEPEVAESTVQSEVPEAVSSEKPIETQANEKSVEALLAQGKALSPDEQGDTQSGLSSKPLSGEALMKKVLGPDSIRKPISTDTAVKEVSAASTAINSDTFPVNDIRGNCRMDSCNFYRIQNVNIVGSTGNGRLLKVEMISWGAEYDNKPNEYEQTPRSIGEKSVDQEYYFCSKTRPAAYYREDNQWYSRNLRLGDQNDVTNFTYDRYVKYWAVCHHRMIADPYNVSGLDDLGYSFAPLPDGTGMDAKKIADPNDVLK